MDCKADSSVPLPGPSVYWNSLGCRKSVKVMLTTLVES